MEDSEDKKVNVDVRKGFFIGSLLHVIGTPSMMGASALLLGQAVIGLLFIGILQSLYMVPAALIARSKDCSRDFQKGLFLSAVALFLLSAVCFGCLFLSLALGGSWYDG